MQPRSYRHDEVNASIDDIGVTSDTLTGRGGLALFSRYVTHTGVPGLIERLFGSIRRSRKGRPVTELFMQLMCFFVDGTHRHLTGFDQLKSDSGYAYVIGIDQQHLASSHTIKRLFGNMWINRAWLYRRLFRNLFIWRLNVERPQLIELGLDTTILNNGTAQQRMGVKPTYKKQRRGFKPLLLFWGPYVVDAVMRGGNKHCNNGDTVAKMVRRIVADIRKRYNSKVPIIMRCDSAFFDQKLFEVFEELNIGYIVVGKVYKDIRAYVAEARQDGQIMHRRSGDHTWAFIEFGDRRGSWSKCRRALYCWPVKDRGQLLMPFSDHDRVYYTNLGMGQSIDRQLSDINRIDLLEARKVVAMIHLRGADELVIRSLEEFAWEKLRFKGFVQNVAYFNTILVSFNLYEAFKRDVCHDVIAIHCYPTTFRRKLIDFAAKVARHAGRVILKVTHATWAQINLPALWARSANPPQIVAVC